MCVAVGFLAVVTHYLKTGSDQVSDSVPALVLLQTCREAIVPNMAGATGNRPSRQCANRIATE